MAASSSVFRVFSPRARTGNRYSFLFHPLSYSVLSVPLRLPPAFFRPSRSFVASPAPPPLKGFPLLPREKLALLLSQGGRGPNSIDPRCVPTINSLQLHSPAQKIRLRDCVRTQKTGTCFCFYNVALAGFCWSIREAHSVIVHFFFLFTIRLGDRLRATNYRNRVDRKRC